MDITYGDCDIFSSIVFRYYVVIVRSLVWDDDNYTQPTEDEILKKVN